MAISVEKVSDSKKGMKDFIRLPWTIYKDDPTWAPDLIMDLKARLNKKKHPFFEFGDADFYVAYRDGVPVGRIAGIENRRHIEFRKEHIGFWGFFECIDDQEVANALFAAAKQWNKDKGYDTMRGPMSCDTQDEIGTVIEGFNQQRYFIMPHNHAYYPVLIEKIPGMAKAKDLIAFQLDLKKAIPENVKRVSEIAQARLEKQGFTFRTLNKKNIVHDFRQIMAVYHEGWKDNWGFVPASETQFMSMAEQMKLVADAGLVIIIEGPKGEPVAMAVALYDWMESTLWARKFPFALQESMQLVNLLWKLFLKPKPKFSRGRLFLAGVMPEYRGRGMDALLYVLPFQAGKDHGVSFAELSWELEDNYPILSPITKMGGEVYKKMRVWDAPTK